MEGCDTFWQLLSCHCDALPVRKELGLGSQPARGMVSELCEQEQLHQEKELCWKLLLICVCL